MLSYVKLNFYGEEIPMNAAEAIKAKKAAEVLNNLGYYPEFRVDISPKIGIFTQRLSARRQINGKRNYSKIIPAYLV